MNTQTLDFKELKADLSAIHQSLTVAALALDVENSTQPATQTEEADLQAIMGLGVLLNDLHRQKARLTKMAAVLPSPNQVSPAAAPSVAAAGRDIFATLNEIRALELEVYKTAKLDLKRAASRALEQALNPKMDF